MVVFPARPAAARKRACWQLAETAWVPPCRRSQDGDQSTSRRTSSATGLPAPTPSRWPGSCGASSSSARMPRLLRHASRQCGRALQRVRHVVRSTHDDHPRRHVCSGPSSVHRRVGAGSVERQFVMAGIAALCGHLSGTRARPLTRSVASARQACRELSAPHLSSRGRYMATWPCAVPC